MTVTVTSGVAKIVIGCLVTIVLPGCRTTLLPPPEALPVLTVVNVPSVFEANAFDGRALYFSVSGRNLDPLSRDRVRLSLRDATKRPIDAVFSPEPTAADLLFRDGQVTLDVIASGLAGGSYEICAALASTPAQLVCGGFLLLLQDEPSTCERRFAEILARNPDFGCRCDAGTVRIDPAESPDGTLGRFTRGGNTFGSVSEGSLRDRALSSAFKFAAHFRVELVNDPGRPAECTDEQWFRLATTRCGQGQDLNGTLTGRVGTPREARFNQQDEAGNEFPYDPDAREAGDFTRDRHGYRATGRSRSPAVDGNLKTHDAPDLVHWLDVPGLNNRPPDRLNGLEPIRQDNLFRQFVTGSTGRAEDNCECFVGLRTGVIDANGDAQPATVTVAPVCR